MRSDYQPEMESWSTNVGGCAFYDTVVITRKLKGAFRGRPRRPIWISLGSELFRCGKLRERMTKEQSNGVPERRPQRLLAFGRSRVLAKRQFGRALMDKKLRMSHFSGRSPGLLSSKVDALTVAQRTSALRTESPGGEPRRSRQCLREHEATKNI
jgi:hypothetical protein